MIRIDTAKFKSQLQKIQKQNYRLPEGFQELEAVQFVAGSLGSPDGELRDELGYTILFQWLVKQHLLEGPQLRVLLEEALSEDRLYFKMGESESDSVFQRTFSALLIALILLRDNEEHFLSQDDFLETLHRMVDYCKLEKDFRSFVSEKGWAHAPAHISDALDECVRSRFAGLDECKALWDGLQGLIKQAPHVFDAEEDERMTIPLIAMVELKKVPFPVMLDWLKKIALPKPEDEPDYAAKRVAELKRINCKHLIRCLYMRMKEKGLLEKEEEAQLFELEHKFNPVFFNI